jgi:hypothetical protein
MNQIQVHYALQVCDFKVKEDMQVMIEQKYLKRVSNLF